MQPDTQNPGSNLPSTEKGEVGVQKNTLEVSVANPENKPKQPSASSAANPVQGTQPAVQLNDDSQASAVSSSQSSTGSFQDQVAQLPAEDSDTIENEWIEKVDEIESKTANDPYSEDDAQHALSRAYLKKRFGLDVK